MTNALLTAMGPEDRLAPMAVGQKRAFLRRPVIGLETTRGSITVVNREALEARACECYDPARSVRDLRMHACDEHRVLTAAGVGRA